MTDLRCQESEHLLPRCLIHIPQPGENMPGTQPVVQSPPLTLTLTARPQVPPPHRKQQQPWPYRLAGLPATDRYATLRGHEIP